MRCAILWMKTASLMPQKYAAEVLGAKSKDEQADVLESNKG